MKNFTSCFKEKKFLRFFFNQMRINNTGRYREFPYLSICGKERNFIRCDDCPFVYTHVIQKDVNEDYLAYNHAGDLLMLRFEPEKVFMLPETGRVYHPAPERVGEIGLIRSKLAIEFSKFFEFKNGEQKPPTNLKWKDQDFVLDNEWYYKVIGKRKKNYFLNR